MSDGTEFDAGADRELAARIAYLAENLLPVLETGADKVAPSPMPRVRLHLVGGKVLEPPRETNLGRRMAYLAENLFPTRAVRS